MAKIFIAGNVFVVQSSVQLEKLRLLEKYRPESLKLKDEDGNVVFVVGTGSGSINNIGVSFKDASHDEHKLACITLPVPFGTEDAKKYVADYVGLSFLNLQNIESRLEAALEDIEDDMAEILGSITYMADAAQTPLTQSGNADGNTDGGEAI